MSAPGTNRVLSALSPRDTDELSPQRTQLGEIDDSCRGSVLLFFISGMVWLLIGTVFAIVASYKLHSPDFLGDYAWLTFGRIRTAHLNAVIYGFSAEIAVGVILWLMCRLCRVPLMAQSVINSAAVLWNVGLLLGIGGILAGDTTGVEYLEMPKYSTPILFLAFALIAVWTIVIFRFRREKHLYVSQWYILAAVLWFPWLYSTAQLLLVMDPARGAVQAAVNWWFAHNVLGLWFTPIGLASIYYFLPKAGLDDHDLHRGVGHDGDSGGLHRDQPPLHDDRPLWEAEAQPDPSLHRVRRHELHGVQSPGRSELGPLVQ